MDEFRHRHGRHEVVYYIRRGDCIKIGTTAHFRGRMAALRPDEVLAIEPGGAAVEEARHAQFAQCHIPDHPNGTEWFKATPDLLAHTAELAAKTPIPDLSARQPATLARRQDTSIRGAQSDFHVELGRKLRELRINEGLTQHQLAERLSVDQTTLSYIELGKRRLPVQDIQAVLRGIGGWEATAMYAVLDAFSVMVTTPHSPSGKGRKSPMSHRPSAGRKIGA